MGILEHMAADFPPHPNFCGGADGIKAVLIDAVEVEFSHGLLIQALAKGEGPLGEEGKDHGGSHPNGMGKGLGAGLAWIKAGAGLE
jgi:hypothetical protein